MDASRYGPEEGVVFNCQAPEPLRHDEILQLESVHQNFFAVVAVLKYRAVTSDSNAVVIEH